MAGVAAAVANGGIAFKPHLLKKVLDGNELVREQKADLRANFAHFGLTTEKIELVRKGMWRVVMEDGGTARAARITNVEVAGKTGTAQNWRHNAKGELVKDNHTLFITFAPYVNPKFACCILVQGGKGGGVSAAPIAKRIMEQALALDTGYQVALAPVAEVEGNFNPVEVVSFEGMAPVQLPGSSEEEAGDSGDNEPPPKRPARAEQNERVRAAVRPEADEEGSRNVRNNQQPAPRRANIFKRIFGR
jgi:penicillin-binding protein 2